MKDQWRAEVALAIVSLLWGSTFVLIKNALPNISTLLFLAMRFGLATVALWVIFRNRRGGKPDLRAEIVGGILSGLCLMVGYAMQTWGLELTTPAKSAFITGLYIVLVPLLAGVVYWKEPHPSEMLGVVVAGSGVMLLTLPDTRFQVSSGDLLTLGCAVAFALQILVVGHYARRGSFERLTLIQLGTVAAVSGATFSWVETPRVTWTATVVAAVIVTGLAATALAFAVQTWAQARTTPTRAALIFALEPAFGGLTSVLAGSDPFTASMMSGCVLVLAGIVLAELKPIRWPRHPSI